MAVGQLPAETGTFARYLRELAALLDRGSGWYAVFWQRDPEGMRACFEGREVPPWDVVASLLQDLAGVRGSGFAESEEVRARSLHGASAAAYDRRAGGREALAERLEMMLAERRYAAGREQELAHGLRTAAGGGEAQRLGDELAWVRDDGRRASARCDELRARLVAVDREAEPQLAVPPGWFRPDVTGPVPRQRGESEVPEPVVRAEAEAPAAPPAKRRRPRGARFAGIEDDADVMPAPALPVPPAAPAAVPRGARFGGAVHEERPEPEVVRPQGCGGAAGRRGERRSSAATARRGAQR